MKIKIGPGKLRSQNFLVDTGFLFSLFDETESDHAAAQKMFDIVEECNLLLPWPVMYEAINTKFIRKKMTIHKFRLFIRRPNFNLLDDSAYRDVAFNAALDTEVLNKASLTDWIIRFMIEDKNIKIHGLITNNYADFAGVCVKRNIPVLDVA